MLLQILVEFLYQINLTYSLDIDAVNDFTLVHHKDIAGFNQDECLLVDKIAGELLKNLPILTKSF